MKKSNLILFALLAVASAFLLWLWFHLGFNNVDSPFDLVLSVLWWAMMACLAAGIAKVESTRRRRIRTVYLAADKLFNSEKGVLPLVPAADVRETLANLIDGLRYDFTLEDFPAKGDFEPTCLVRSRSFDARRSNDAATGESRLEVTKWTGSVYHVAQGQEREFKTPEELTGILMTM